MDKLELDTPSDKGVSERQKLEKVYKQSGKIPKRLEQCIEPDLWDSPIFDIFLDVYQAGKEFYQTIYFYQKITTIEFDGEDLTLLNLLWKTADKFYHDKNKQKNTPKKKEQKLPNSKQIGR